jgi:hypothetical protein
MAASAGFTDNYWSGWVKSSAGFWHMNCAQSIMARKMNPSKLALETSGQDAVSNRRSATEPSALYLMRLPLPKAKNQPLKRRLPVFIDAETRAQIEHPVKIIHAG